MIHGGHKTHFQWPLQGLSHWSRNLPGYMACTRLGEVYIQCCGQRSPCHRPGFYRWYRDIFLGLNSGPDWGLSPGFSFYGVDGRGGPFRSLCLRSWCTQTSQLKETDGGGDPIVDACLCRRIVLHSSSYMNDLMPSWLRRSSCLVASFSLEL